jgi:multidrug efflux pump
MASFFIDRPIFAWVIALFIACSARRHQPAAGGAVPTGGAADHRGQSAAYPGASAQTLEDSVLAIIEREMNGAPGMIYMESVAQANGSGSHHATFEPGTNVPTGAGGGAEPPVARHAAAAVGRHPAGRARGQGALELPARSSRSPDRPGLGPRGLGDYASRNVLPEMQRIPGVGQAQLFGTERAMRIWIDPARLQGLRPEPADVVATRSGRRTRRWRPARSVSCRMCPGRASRPPWWSAGSSIASSSLARCCCAPTPTARACGCAMWPASSLARRDTPRRRA